MSEHRDRPPLLPAAGEEAIARVTARAHEESVSLVWFLYADHGGIIRGKSATAPMLPARMVTGIGHTVAMMAMSMLDHLQPVDGMGPVGEVRLMPDPATFVPLPYAPGAGAMLADQVLPVRRALGRVRAHLPEAGHRRGDRRGLCGHRGVRAGVHPRPPGERPGRRP